jgi:hypothetical protein
VPAGNLLPPGAKPHLNAAAPDLAVCGLSQNDIREAIGYVFPSPERFLALWAAPLQPGASSDWEGKTVVGVVGIGQDPAQATNPLAGAYFVAIDLSTAAEVSPENPVTVEGFLIRCEQPEEIVPLIFEGSYQEQNPIREAWPGQHMHAANTIDVSIGADRVCFLYIGDDPVYAVRYCPRQDQEAIAYLSVMAQFPDRYGVLVQNMLGWAAEAGVDSDLVLTNRVIAEYEMPARLQECDPREPETACEPDIVGAPLAHEAVMAAFAAGSQSDQGQDYGGVVEGKCWLAVGVVQVLNPMEFTIPGEGRTEIPPGSYVVKYWYDNEECDQSSSFLAATVSNVQVEEIPIPAVPASYCDGVDDDECISLGEPRSEISAWHLLNCCLFWQSRCP